MQPALADVVQNLTFPASAATAIAFRAAMMSLPWCGPPARASPKSSVYSASPTTGKTSFGVAARSARAVATRTTARPARRRRGVARAVVRWLAMRERAPVRCSKSPTLAGPAVRRHGTAAGLEFRPAMKIAVCVKQVPEQAKRIDPQTKRLDRSPEGALNAFDVNAVEEALRLKEQTGDG